MPTYTNIVDPTKTKPKLNSNVAQMSSDNLSRPIAG